MRNNQGLLYLLALSAALGGTACSSSSAASGANGVDGGRDGASTDSGPTRDSAAAQDSAVPLDSTSPVDSASAETSPASAITVQTYTASGAPPGGLAVNSHLLLGKTQAVLVDGQLYKADAQAVVQMIQASGRNLTTVFLTHAHPDHYLEFDVYRAAFPSAAFVTTAAVLADFNASAPGTFQYLKSTLGSLVADALVTPTVLAGTTLSVDGEIVSLLELPNAGESAHGAALALPAEAALVSGDLLYDDVNLFLGECHAAGWQTNLSAFMNMPFTTYYPGHGPKIGASVFAADSQYITDATQILQAAAASDAGPIGDAGDPRINLAVTQIQAKYPSYQSLYLLDYSVQQYFANCAH